MRPGAQAPKRYVLVLLQDHGTGKIGRQNHRSLGVKSHQEKKYRNAGEASHLYIVGNKGGCRWSGGR